MYDNNKSFSNNRNNNYPNKNFDNKTMFTAEFIKKGFRNDKGKLRPDLFSDEAKNIALQLTSGKKPTTPTQLRAFYGEVKALQNRMEDEEESFEDILPFILMLKSKASYKYGTKNIPIEFRNFIFSVVDEIKKVNTKQAFEDFCYFFEAIIGFSYELKSQRR